MTKEKSDGFSGIFLESFVKSLIENSSTNVPQQNITGFKKQETIPSAKEITQINPFQQTLMPSMSNNMQISMMPSLHSTEYPFSNQKIIQEETVGSPLQNNFASSGIIEQRMPQRPMINQLTSPPQMSPLMKINPFLQDPRVLSVECSGPGKNIILNKGGFIQTLPFQLSLEEIDELINHFAQRARIPPIGGVFKAAIGNLIISAVISDFAGTRFHIEKKVGQITPVHS